MIRSGPITRVAERIGAARLAFGLFLLAVPFCVAGAQSSDTCNTANLFAQANALLKTNKADDATVVLDHIRLCKGLPAVTEFNLAWFYGRAHQFSTALKIFQALSPDVPTRATHQYAVALTLFEAGDTAGATTVLEGSRSEGLLDARSTNLLGVAYSKLGNYDKAYSILAEELKQQQPDVMPYLNMVTLFIDTGNLPKALELSSRAALNFPRDPEVFLVRGAILVLLGEFSIAHGDFQTAVELAPAQAEPRFLLALSDYKQNRFEGAGEELRAAIASGIADSDLHYLLAECILGLDHTNTTDAITQLGVAIDLNGDSVPARELRGRLLLETGRTSQAVADLEVAHRKDASSRSAAFGLARAYSKLGRKQEAKALFDQTSKGFTSDLADQRNMELLDGMSQRKLNDLLTGAPAQ